MKLTPLILFAFTIAALYAFGFYAFSGAIDLTNPTISGIVSSFITQMANIIALMAAHYYKHKPEV